MYTAATSASGRNPDAARETPTQPTLLPTFVSPSTSYQGKFTTPPATLNILLAIYRDTHIWLGPSPGIPSKRRKSLTGGTSICCPCRTRASRSVTSYGYPCTQHSTSTAAMLYRLESPPNSCPLFASLLCRCIRGLRGCRAPPCTLIGETCVVGSRPDHASGLARRCSCHFHCCWCHVPAPSDDPIATSTDQGIPSCGKAARTCWILLQHAMICAGTSCLNGIFWMCKE
jgi:hypothetical protein